MNIDFELVNLISGSRIIGSELFIPAYSANLALDILEDMGLAVFKVEAFTIESDTVRPILSGILDLCGGKEIGFDSFVTYSIRQSRDFINQFQNKIGKFDRLYFNFLYDNSLN